MKITIDIPDEEIEKLVAEKLSDHIAERLLEREWTGEAHIYRKVIKEVVREIIKSDMDNLSDRAVNAAAKSIETKGVKKLMGKLTWEPES